MSLILAIDLGKYNSVFCLLDPDSGEPEFRSVKTSPAMVRKELLRRTVDRVVIEACTPAGWVHDLCGELGLQFMQVVLRLCEARHETTSGMEGKLRSRPVVLRRLSTTYEN